MLKSGIRAVLLLLLLPVSLFAQWQSAIVHYDSLGRLVYVPDANGNRIPDFSHAGYRGGGVDLPAVPVVSTISAVAGDNTANIQNALNLVAAMPLDGSGIRGALLLNPGVYRISGTVHVNASGVVLRGSGQGADSTTNTVLLGTGNSPVERDIIVAGGGSNTKWSGKVSGTQTDIIDDTVYVGSSSFTVTDASAYSVGDNIVIYHPCSDLWLQAVNYGGTNGTELWTVGEQPIVFNRNITGISGNTITVDVPVFNTLVRSLSQSYIYKYNRSGLKTTIGVENLRVDMTGWEPDTVAQDKSAWTAIAVSQLEDGWVKNCTALHFVYACVRTETATRITIDSCTGTNPIGSVDASDPNHRRYTFALDDASQQVLMQNCLAVNGRHSFMSNGTTWTSGDVFYNVRVQNPFAPSEPHRRWSMGILYDNFRQLNGPLPGYASELLGFYNRGDMGTGHGWAAAHCVAWNCNVANGDILVQKPPTAQNYAIGCFGNKITGSAPPAPFVQPQGYIEGSKVANLNPPSLYMAQLQERLGGRQLVRSGNWSDPAVWSTATVPGLVDDVTIPSGDTITVDITDAQCRNLVVNGTLLFPNNADGRGLTIGGNLVIGSTGTLKTVAQTVSGAALVHTIVLYGDLSNISGGTFDLRSGSGSNVASNTICAANVTFAGSSNSTVTVGTRSSNNNEFNAITVNKSGSAGVVLHSDVFTNTASSVAGAFITLTNGIVAANGHNLVCLATSSSSVSGGSAASYVNGSLGRSRSSSNGTIFFPVGDSAGYRPITVSTSTTGLTTNQYLTASVVHAPANSGSSALYGNLASVSSVRYYVLTYVQSSSSSASITLARFAPSYGSDDGFLDGIPELRVAVSADSRVTWTGRGPEGQTADLSDPPTTIVSDTLVSGQITLTDGQSMFVCVGMKSLPVPDPPVPLTPAERETVRTLTPPVIWSCDDTTVTKFWLEYSPDSLFAGSVIDSVLTDTSVYITGLEDGVTYYWRLRAKNFYGWGGYSPVRRFTALISAFIPVSLAEGWNLVSVPARLRDRHVPVSFPHAVSDPFIYKTGYARVDSLKSGPGYWIKSDSLRGETFVGVPVEIETVTVAQGWNLVGCPSGGLRKDSVRSIPPSNVISQWFAYHGSYSGSDSLVQCSGYWVKVDTAGILILRGFTAPAAQALVAPKSPAVNPVRPPKTIEAVKR